MDRLSVMITAALRAVPASGAPPTPAQVELLTLGLRELLVDLAIFAQDMERTEAIHDRDEARQRLEREGAARRLYARLVEPPHANDMLPTPRGIGRGNVVRLPVAFAGAHRGEGGAS